jgi:hypothetical protein
MQDLLSTPGARVLPLRPAERAPGASGYAVWSPIRGVVVVSAASLPVGLTDAVYRVRVTMSDASTVWLGDLPSADGSLLVTVAMPEPKGRRVTGVDLFRDPPGAPALTATLRRYDRGRGALAARRAAVRATPFGARREARARTAQSGRWSDPPVTRRELQTVLAAAECADRLRADVLGRGPALGREADRDADNARGGCHEGGALRLQAELHQALLRELHEYAIEVAADLAWDRRLLPREAEGLLLLLE